MIFCRHRVSVIALHEQNFMTQNLSTLIGLHLCEQVTSSTADRRHQ